VDGGAAAEAGQDDVVVAHDWAVMTGLGEESPKRDSPDDEVRLGVAVAPVAAVPEVLRPRAQKENAASQASRNRATASAATARRMEAMRWRCMAASLPAPPQAPLKGG
jgi:hypothetical protein